MKTGVPPTPAAADSPAVVSPAPPVPAKPPRIASIDALRGFVMTLMLAEVLDLPAMGRIFSHSAFWSFVAFHNEHVDWQGCSLHDLIQPCFTLLVGISLPFSIAARRAKGSSFRGLLGHAVWRSLVLIFLGIFLRSFGHKQTNFTFEDTLTQIGLGYAFVFLLAWTRVRTQVIALALILVGYWALFAFYPAPPANFDYASVGVPANNVHEYTYTGFQSHWNMNSNAAWAFDQWFMNALPREKPFVYNHGGYSTLSFIPTLGTMIIGLLAGEWLWRPGAAAVKLKWLLIAGVSLTVAALLIQALGICPIVKKIWTPSWTLYSGGLVLLMLSFFYGLMEWKGWRAWAFPLMVVGMNSIAIYFMSWTMKPFVETALVTHLGQGTFLIFGQAFQQLLLGAAVMVVLWVILFWMYRRKLFLKI